MVLITGNAENELFTCPSDAAVGDAVYVSGSKTVAYADVSDIAKFAIGVIWLKVSSTTCKIRFNSGIVQTSGLTIAAIYCLTDTATTGNTISTSVSELEIGIALSTTELFIDILSQHKSVWSNNIADAKTGGIEYLGGFYQFNGASYALTQAAASDTLGTANISYAAHAMIVAQAAGSVTGGGTVALEATGVTIDDQGTRSAAQTVTISADITAISANEMIETTQKWLGQVTFQLTVTSGTPSAYSLTFNGGFAKYFDHHNKDFVISGAEVVGLAKNNDDVFEIELLHHQNSNFTYGAGGEPTIGAGNKIMVLDTDHSTDSELATDHYFAFKRDDLTTTIAGSAAEGILWKFVFKAATNSLRNANCTVEYLEI